MSYCLFFLGSLIQRFGLRTGGVKDVPERSNPFHRLLSIIFGMPRYFQSYKVRCIYTYIYIYTYTYIHTYIYIHIYIYICIYIYMYI